MKIEGEPPFIHCIETPLGQYVFDVGTNQFVLLHDQSVFKFLQNVEYSGKNPAVYPDSLEGIHKKGYLSSKRPERMKHMFSDILKYQLEHNIEQMTLQVTQQCNFRCSYCTYAAKDFLYQREHTSKNMLMETALTAVKFFFEHADQQDTPTIGFYGGEPMLELNLIQEIMCYSEKLFDGKDLHFTMTTNGSLLTREAAKILSDHNIKIMISLDGTPDVQNRSRKFAANGQGTFTAIERNLRILQKEFPMLYQSISFNVVVDPRFCCDELHLFFNNTDLFRDKQIQYSLIDDTLGMERTISTEQFRVEHQQHRFKALLAKLNKYPQQKASKLAKQALQTSLETTHKNLLHGGIWREMSHSGPCLPGQRRLFVDVEGNLYPCERVSETSAAMRIGTLWDGFDYEHAKELLNVSTLTEDTCRNCWVLRHCTICSKQCDNNGSLSSTLKRSHCSIIRNTVENNFRDYLLLKEFSMHY